MTETDRIAMIERLHALLQAGALTQEEFAREKARLLGDGASGDGVTGDGDTGDGGGGFAAAEAEEPQADWPETPMAAATDQNFDGIEDVYGDEAEAEAEAQAEAEFTEDPAPRGWWIAALVALALIAVGGGAWLAWSLNLTGSSAASEEPAPTPSATTPAPSPMPRTAEQALIEAFKTVTGHDKAFTRESEEGMVTVAPLRLLDLPFGKVLLTEASIADGCHGCAGSIGVHYLVRQGQAWVAGQAWPDAVRGWGWGQPPREWNITDRFTEYPAIYSEGGFTMGGVTCGGAHLTELRPDGPASSDVIGLYFDNAGMVDDETGVTEQGEPRIDLKGEIASVVKDAAFEVRVTGTENFTERYVKRDGRFVREGGESRMGC